MDRPKIELKLPVIANMELVAVQTAEVVAKHMDLSEDKAAEISMALIEACINAFEHSQAQNNVFIHFILEENSLVIKVIDQGIGFDKAKVEIPAIENKLGTDERKRGWGLQLIQELMDSVEFESSKDGTTVTMTKNKEV
ncbi:MAG: ATP-binding protein [Saprospiraceae bacterium]|jgi:anti-sigma regulatory factor (Ser/Thr protein kinase)|nr:ATP-binding protein [Saprospiraceae bacterium]